jgi:hypothetical protein
MNDFTALNMGNNFGDEGKFFLSGVALLSLNNIRKVVNYIMFFLPTPIENFIFHLRIKLTVAEG